MRILKILTLILYSSNKKEIGYSSTNFQEVRTYVKTEIIYDDKIGCSEEYKKFSKELLVSQYNLPSSDYVKIDCKSIIDHKGVKHTKRYKEIKVPIL